MKVTKFGYILEVDIHGMRVAEAKRELERLLSTCDNSITQMEITHGYHGGQALLNLARNDLKHPRIESRRLSMNNGVTTLILKKK